MPTDRHRIASLVRGELAIAGMSGRKLAAALGWSADSTLRRMRGTVPFRAEELAVIARLLGVPATRFMEDRDHTPSERAS